MLRILTDAGLVILALDTNVNIKRLAARDVEGVFVDIDFCGGSAVNLLARIREHNRSAALIAFTANADPVFSASCFIAGVDSIVSKKSSGPEIVAELERVIAERPARGRP